MEKVKREKPKLTNRVIWNWYQEIQDLTNGGSVMALFLQTHIHWFNEQYGKRVQYIQEVLQSTKEKYTMKNAEGKTMVQNVNGQLVSIFKSQEDQMKYSAEVNEFLDSEAMLSIIKPN